MRKLILVAITIALMMFSTVAFSFDIPSPTGYVNDFAQIIPNENRNQLEQKLQDYEKQTSIEIAVVTTSSLDGLAVEQWTIELVEKPGWGVGKKGKDNGIVIVVAPNERKYRIEVGRGLEGDLPDSAAGSLGREHLVPFFKRKDYAGGIENLVGGIMETLGIYNEEERIKIREQKAQAALEEAAKQMQREKEMKAFLGTAVTVVAGIALLAGIVFGIILVFRKISRAIKEANRKKALRLEIDSDIEMYRKKADLLSEKIKSVKETGENFPEWASRNLRKCISNASQKIESARKGCDSTLEIAKSDPDEAKTTLGNVQNFLKVAEAEIKKAGLIPAEIELYKNRAGEEITEAETDLSKTEADIKKAVTEGFKIGDISEGLKEKAKALSEFKEVWSAGDEKLKYLKGLDSLNAVKEIRDGILAVSNKLNLIVKTKKYVEDDLASFPAKTAEIEQSIGRCRDALGKIKKSYPEENWKDINEGFLAIPGALMAAKKLFASAGEKNSMASQKFYEAEKNMADANNLVESSRKSLENISMRQLAIDKAKSFFAENLENVALNVETATKKVKDSDVSSKAKGISREAEEKLEKVRTYSGNGKIINWILAAATIGVISELAASAVKIANSDISNAEEERRRARRRREESSRSSYSSGHSSSSSSSSSSSGGFGGGGFSGGGASGGW